jgi:cytochrome P450
MSDTSRPAEWVVNDLADVHAVLADDRFIVRPAEAGAPAGTVAWLRASVSRFANGPEHDRRRALVVAELDRLDPGALRAAVRDQARTALKSGAESGAGPSLEAVAGLARRAPAMVLAERFGAIDPAGVATAVDAVAAAYFPGAAEPVERAADAATKSLLDLLAGPGLDEDLVVARITVLVQGYDATANLVAAALSLLPELPADVATDTLLAETAYRRPPVPALRRVAQAPARLGDRSIGAGDSLVCEVAAAGAADGPAAAALTFGYGIRPCPGPAQALALAAGIIDALRE